MLSLPREEACKRATWCCMKCSMGLGFLTWGTQLMLCFFWAVQRSQTGASCAARMEMYSVSPSACLGSYSVGLCSEEKGLSLALKPGCIRQGASARDTGRDGGVLRAVGLPRMFSLFDMHVLIPNCRDPWGAGIQAPIRGPLSGARTVCSIPSSKSQCFEGAHSIFFFISRPFYRALMSVYRARN